LEGAFLLPRHLRPGLRSVGFGDKSAKLIEPPLSSGVLST
jgi:hypothetical protein